MAHQSGRRRTPIAPPPEKQLHLVQTRVNDECDKAIKDRASATGLSTASWLRMFLYEQLGVTPKKE